MSNTELNRPQNYNSMKNTSFFKTLFSPDKLQYACVTSEKLAMSLLFYEEKTNTALKCFQLKAKVQSLGLRRFKTPIEAFEWEKLSLLNVNKQRFIESVPSVRQDAYKAIS